MNGYEFARFMETEEGKQRHNRFAKLDRCENNDVDYIIECDEETARDNRLFSEIHTAARHEEDAISRFET